MHLKLLKLSESLEKFELFLSDTEVLGTNTFDQYGWNIAHLDCHDLVRYLNSFLKKLKLYDIDEISEKVESAVDSYIYNLDNLYNHFTTYFTPDGNLTNTIPMFLLTLQTLIYELESELFSWERLEGLKLVPKTIGKRIRNINGLLNNFDNACGSLSDKIEIINDAYDAAESLPTDLQSLREAKVELSDLLNKTKRELDLNNKEILSSLDRIKKYELKVQDEYNEIEKVKNKIFEYENTAKGLVKECDDALQITTTQGLAAGFDQKAQELKKSIWIWMGGLLLALAAGITIGSERVSDLNNLLSTSLSTGQVVLQLLISLFSIGGPLWLAWISTQQINQRFKLSEDYSYKATVAKAFTGFSKIAQRFDPETEERLFNSTLDRLDEMPLRLLDSKDYNSPWHEFLDSEAFKKAIDIVPALAAEAGRFASKTRLKKKSVTKDNSNIEQISDYTDENKVSSE